MLVNVRGAEHLSDVRLEDEIDAVDACDTVGVHGAEEAGIVDHGDAGDAHACVGREPEEDGAVFYVFAGWIGRMYDVDEDFAVEEPRGFDEREVEAYAGLLKRC